MIIRVWGESAGLETGELKNAIHFFGNQLLGKRMCRRIKLNVELIPYMRGICGSITCSDWRKPRSFLMQVETGGHGRRKQLYIIAHEMVHLKQVVRGELSVKDGSILWKHDRHPSNGFEDEPWEEEAFARERELYRAFKAGN